jgi:hypothetical protein
MFPLDTYISTRYSGYSHCNISLCWAHQKLNFVMIIMQSDCVLTHSHKVKLWTNLGSLMGFLSQNYDSGIRDRNSRWLIWKFSFDIFGALSHTNPGLCSSIVILLLSWRLPCLECCLINAHSNLVVSCKIRKIVILDHPSLGINLTGTIFHVLNWSKNHWIWPWKISAVKISQSGNSNTPIRMTNTDIGTQLGFV